MRLHDLIGKKILIAGYGIEGKAVHAYLMKHKIGSLCGIADDVSAPEEFKKQSDYDIAIRSPSLSHKRLFIPYTTLTNIFFANTKTITIGITGTKGKSTTTALIYHMLKSGGKQVHLGGNIGRPLTEILDQEHNGDFSVVELSSYQLEDIKYSPHITVFINFFPEHMDYHGGISEYWQAKSSIVSHVTENDYFIYNNDYEKLPELARSLHCKSIPFPQNIPIPDNEIPLLGIHNKNNIRATYAVAKILNVTDAVFKASVKSFISLPHRLENIGTYREITFYDDAISTTPQSTICAIEAVPTVATLFLGGLDRGYDFSTLSKVIIKYNIPTVVLFPTSGSNIKKDLLKAGYTGRLVDAESMKRAVSYAYKYTSPGSSVLLSCASPSYSLWKNFEAKGEEFKKEVIEQGHNS